MRKIVRDETLTDSQKTIGVQETREVSGMAKTWLDGL
jgi:hypothetical protein